MVEPHAVAGDSRGADHGRRDGDETGGHEPRYPDVLHLAGIEGRVVIEAVLDTTGRAEAGSLSVIGDAHPLFAAEAERVVLSSRYRPGRTQGRAVRVRVRVPVSFSLRP